MPYRLLYKPALNLLESFVDNVLRDKVEAPIEGAVLYCDLAAGYGDHSGIYIGDNKIVHLDGSGEIEVVNPKQFRDRLGGFNTAMSVYVSCNGDFAVGSKKVAKRAKQMIGKRREYNFLFNNCHQFSAGCLHGDFDKNACNFLWMLKKETERQLDANTWRVWNVELFD